MQWWKNREIAALELRENDLAPVSPDIWDRRERRKGYRQVYSGGIRLLDLGEATRLGSTETPWAQHSWTAWDLLGSTGARASNKSQKEFVTYCSKEPIRFTEVYVCLLAAGSSKGSPSDVSDRGENEIVNWLPAPLLVSSTTTEQVIWLGFPLISRVYTDRAHLTNQDSPHHLIQSNQTTASYLPSPRAWSSPRAQDKEFPTCKPHHGDGLNISFMFFVPHYRLQCSICSVWGAEQYSCPHSSFADNMLSLRSYLL